MSIALKRNYNLYISKAANGSQSTGNTVQLLVKDFSFNQRSNIDKVSRETLNAAQERTVDPYIRSIAPVNFSFTTYIKPLVSTNVTSPEEYLWVSLMGSDLITNSPTQATIDFADGNVGSLHELTLWFTNPNFSDTSYRIDNAIVDSATISFDVNDIATIEWEGRGLALLRDSDGPSNSADRTAVTECVKNKLSTITLQTGDSPSTVYTVALTGGSIKFENNCKFYNTSQLGKTVVPNGHYTGNREISGDLNFYFKHGTSWSADLYDAILSNADSDTYESTYYADITINIGGTTEPYIQVNIPKAILEIPEINFEEALTISVPFTAQEESNNYSSVIYYAT